MGCNEQFSDKTPPISRTSGLVEVYYINYIDLFCLNCPILTRLTSLRPPWEFSTWFSNVLSTPKISEDGSFQTDFSDGLIPPSGSSTRIAVIFLKSSPRLRLKLGLQRWYRLRPKYLQSRSRKHASKDGDHVSNQETLKYAPGMVDVQNETSLDTILKSSIDTQNRHS